MQNKSKVRVGIIGCGNISQAYFNGAKLFEVLEVVACADLNPEAAKAKAAENGCVAQTVDELLANPEVDLVVNLTIPAVHAEISLAALNAGKHVHCEKPLAVHLEDAKKVIDLAEEKGLLVGCAPDTFLGAGLQTARKMVDDGWIGKVFSGTAFLMSRGPESWHPNPAFFYEAGGGPMFDMGPYYITALVHLLGPVKEVSGVTTRAFEERIATCKEQFGKLLPVSVPFLRHSRVSFGSHCDGNDLIRCAQPRAQPDRALWQRRLVEGAGSEYLRRSVGNLDTNYRRVAQPSSQPSV
jgi:predicted dehydrogenase